MALTNEFEVEVYGELILYQNQIKKILEEYFEMKGIPAQLESSGKDLTIHTHENNFKDFPRRKSYLGSYYVELEIKVKKIREQPKEKKGILTMHLHKK